jgi:hypothetical protein
MTTLERRIEALEAMGNSGTPDLVVMHEIVTPGKRGRPVKMATIDGRRYDMNPGETEGEFIARVEAAARERRRLAGTRHPLVLLSSCDEAI